MRGAARWAAVVLWAWSSLAPAHPRGAHKKILITLEADRLGLLVALDLDGGEPARLLRVGADLDRDGRLSGPEVTALKQRIARAAREHLRLSLAGAELRIPDGEVRFSLRQDASLSDTGLSVALLAELPVPGRIRPGMELRIEDRAPDGSEVDVEVSELGEPEATSRRHAFTVAEGRQGRFRVGRLRGGLTR